MEAAGSSGHQLLKTVAACVLAPLAFGVVGMLVALILNVTTIIFTVIRPGIVYFVDTIVGTFAGMYAARYACDTWLKGYMPQIVFVVFAALLAAVTTFELLTFPISFGKAASYAQIILLWFLSYSLFWRYDAVD